MGMKWKQHKAINAKHQTEHMFKTSGKKKSARVHKNNLPVIDQLRVFMENICVNMNLQDQPRPPRRRQSSHFYFSEGLNTFKKKKFFKEATSR